MGKKEIGFCSGCGMPIERELLEKLRSDKLVYCDHCGKEIKLQKKTNGKKNEEPQFLKPKSESLEILREKMEDTLEKAKDYSERALETAEEAKNEEIKLEILKVEYEGGKTTKSEAHQEKLRKKIKKQKLKLIRKKKKAKKSRENEQYVHKLLRELSKQTQNEQIVPRTKKPYKNRIDNWVENINKSVANLLDNVSHTVEEETGTPLQKLIEKNVSKEDLRELQKLGIIPHNSNESIESDEKIVFPEKPEVFSQPFNAYRGKEPFVFVSYSHDDKKLVYSEIERLNNDGFKIWYDEGIPLSTTWNDEVAKSVKDCSCFLVFLSNQSIKSKNVQNEINFALKYDKKIVPIYLDDTELPAGLELQLVSIQGIYKNKMEEQQYHDKIRSDLTGILK